MVDNSSLQHILFKNLRRLGAGVIVYRSASFDNFSLRVLNRLSCSLYSQWNYTSALFYSQVWMPSQLSKKIHLAIISQKKSSIKRMSIDGRAWKLARSSIDSFHAMLSSPKATGGSVKCIQNEPDTSKFHDHSGQVTTWLALKKQTAIPSGKI